MSKIQQELEELTGISVNKGEERQAYLKRLANGVQELDNASYAKITKAAEDWFNECCDASEAKKPVPDFPDQIPDEQPRRRRAAADVEDAKVVDYKPAKGDKVNITTKRGKEYNDVTFIEIEAAKSGDLIVFNDGKEDLDVPYDGATIKPVKSAEAEQDTGRRRRSAEPEDEGPADPKVGDTVEVTNQRGKVYTGVLKEDNDDTIVMELLGGEIEDIDKSRIAKLVVKHAAWTSLSDEKPSSRRSAAKEEPTDDGKAKKIGRGANDGESISDIVLRFVLDDVKASDKEVQAAMTKEKIEFRDSTATINYKLVHKVLDELKERKLLK